MAGEAETDMSDYDSRDDCVKSYYAAIEAKRLRGDADADALARELFHRSNPGAVFAAEDEVTRLFWRKEAQRRMQQVRYKEMAEIT